MRRACKTLMLLLSFAKPIEKKSTVLHSNLRNPQCIEHAGPLRTVFLYSMIK